MSEQIKIPLAAVLTIATLELVKRYKLDEIIDVGQSAQMKRGLFAMMVQAHQNIADVWSSSLGNFPRKMKGKLAAIDLTTEALTEDEVRPFVQLIALAEMAGAEIDDQVLDANIINLLFFLKELSLLEGFPVLVAFLEELGQESFVEKPENED
ncbi:hypothetical protein KJ707_01070 [Patescibacteria group bacterium]|nr:hypothetical protein [Patescibacteria group bacterium]